MLPVVIKNERCLYMFVILLFGNVTIDHGYVPIVVITIRCIHHYDLAPGVSSGVGTAHPSGADGIIHVLVGFVLLDQFSV